MSYNPGYLDYVCPNCFKSLIECECEYAPYRLINIDRNIQDQIRILNNKGYMTTYCCESHCVTDSIYISFAVNYGIGDELPIPEGFVFKKNNNGLYYTYKNKKNLDNKKFFEIKNKQLDILLNWCKELPSRKV